MWFDDKIVEKSVIPESPNLLDSCSITSRILDQLNNMKINDITVDIELQNIISKIDNIEHYEQKKLSFVAEQLSLVMIKGPRRRRYSPDLLTMSCVWRNTSPALYRQIKNEGVLTLPTAKYVRRLSSGLDVDSGFEVSDATRAYHCRPEEKNYRQKIL